MFFFRVTCIGLILTLCTGCVQRRMTIRSNPPGAVVYIDNQEIGTTPVSTNFTFYGKRRIRLVKDGYETIDDLREIRAPWYQYPGADLVSETMVPGEIQDRRTIQYTLQAKQQITGHQLLTEAQSFRATTRSPSASLVAPTDSISTATGTSLMETSVPAAGASVPVTGGYPMVGHPTGSASGITPEGTVVD
ncbi:MAG: PEGA domain-containing protein [Planctomycetia bacterium]|nr:PEGA domain-containing protein [Planctomycetia bacterium]